MEQKSLLKWSLFCSGLFFVMAIIIEYIPIGVVKIPGLAGHREFYKNIVLGLFTGAMFSVVCSRISYKNYRMQLLLRVSRYFFNIAIYLKQMSNSIDHTEIEDSIVIKQEVDYNLGFYQKIIEECELLRNDVEIQILFKKDKELMDKLYKFNSELISYSASISRDLRCSSDVNRIKILLNGIERKVTGFQMRLVEMWYGFAMLNINKKTNKELLKKEIEKVMYEQS